MNIVLANVLMYIAIAAVVFALIVFIVLPFMKNTARYSWDKRICFTIALIFMAIFFLRLIAFNKCGFSSASVLDALLAALKTFLADGDITVEGHFEEIDATLQFLFNNEYPKMLGGCMKATAAIADVAAPLLTLTTVLSIMSQIFPKIKIRCSLFRDKFIFSEVNEETVVLAESIHKQFGKKTVSPMLIVTDAYVDDESENSSELVDRLKKIGCICIKDDILSLNVRVKNKLTYILSYKDKMKNLSVAIKLTEQYNEVSKDILKRQNCIYVFTDLDEAEELLSKACKSLQGRVDKLNGNGKKRYFLPLVIPIKEYKNTIYDLFDRLPLYTPIIGRDRKELNIAVIGTGMIGKEAFLAAFWCGQMLDIKLNITVVSLDAATGFKDELNRIGESILDAAKADVPYCGIALINCDLARVSFDDLINTDISSENSEYKIETFGECCDKLYKTDYYIVSLGSDELNVSTAYQLRKSIERAVLEKKIANDDKAVIAVSVYDSSIEPTVAFEDNNVHIYPFASFESRYSYDNVINKRFITDSQRISDTYDAMTSNYSESDMEVIYGRADKEYSYYKYWANVARRLHQKYAMYSVGVSSKEEIGTYIDKLRDDDLCDRLAWLEHRRWNAHLWTMGYKHFDTKKNFTKTKVHPCLVEIKPDRHHRIPFKLVHQKDKINRVCELTQEQAEDPRYDALDKVCFYYGYSCDTKEFDYPQYSHIRLTDEQILIYLQPQAKDYYSSKLNADTYTYELYKPEICDDGKRVWAIRRYLLDEKTKAGLDERYKNNKDDIADFIITSCNTNEKQFLTREQVIDMLV